MLPGVPPSEYVVRHVDWQLLDGNSSGLKTWGYSAEIPAEKLEVFFAPKEREKRAESNRRRAGETARKTCGRSARLSSCGRECPLGLCFSPGRTKNRFLPVSSKNTAPTLSDAASEEVVRRLRPTLRGERANRGFIYSSGSGNWEWVISRGTANSGVLPNLSVVSLADRPGGREAEMALE